MPVVSPYVLNSEYNLTEMLEHFDSNYIMDVINNKIDGINFASTLPEPNIIASLEEEFKIMYERFPGDEVNAKQIRLQLYEDIIHLLCQKFNLQFDDDNETIDRYSAAFYLYDFLICNRVPYMVNFFVSFIVNNKNTICAALNIDTSKKNKELNTGYGKRLYADPMYVGIAANMKPTLYYIMGLDISLHNIVESVYTAPMVVQFFDDMVTDKGDFCKDYYAAPIAQPDIEPIINVAVRLALQKIVGDTTQGSMHEIMTMTYGEDLRNV